MPEPPLIQVEEMAQGPKPIAGVATSTAAFLGETATGPTRPVDVVSLTDYQRQFGDGPGLMTDAVAGFFGNGGRRAVIARIVPAGPGPATVADYVGWAGDDPSGLAALADAEVALVYAPDALATPGLADALIGHCERAGDRFAVIDAPARGDPLGPRAGWDTREAAYYHPWIALADEAGGTRLVPPGGHVLGVYARVDAERGVFKAPAGELLKAAVGLAHEVTDADQKILNPAGVNLIRDFPGRGILVWGARTLSSDPEWRYISVRRQLIYLQRSIDEGTRWALFEPNNEQLWAQVSETIGQFLLAEWRAGGFHGATPREAFFVRCDRTTMTQDDLDNGRLVCAVGVAPLKPAEFVIFRIGQWTADHHDP